MLNKIVIAISVLTIMFSAAGVTVAAAQHSQPGQPLYAVKTWTEKLQLQQTAQVNEQLQLNQTSADVPLQIRDQLRLQDQTMTGDQLQLREQERLQQSTMVAPNNQGGGNPWAIGTPTPGSGYGPGPGPDGDCTLCTPQLQNRAGNQHNKP